MVSYIKKNKLLSTFILLTFISFVFGILFYALLDASSKNTVSENIVLLFDNKLIDMKTFFFNSLFSNALIWILGISIIGFVVVLSLYLFKVFIFAFEFISLIININSKNFLMVLGYLFPNLLSTSILFILSYYSVSYSVFLFRYLFRGGNYNLPFITKKYIRVLILSFLFMLGSCVLEYFILKHISILKF